MMSCAVSVKGCTASVHEAGAGSIPSTALQVTFGPKEITVRPIPTTVASHICKRKHYLRSYPGGALFNFGIFVGSLILGVAVVSVGPSNLASLFRGADKREVVCLARLWLDDNLGRNSESRVLSIIIRSLKKHTDIKAVIAYSDPSAGHTGTVYRAAGFSFLGESANTPLYRLPDGSIHHCRSVGSVCGTRSLSFFKAQGFNVELVPQARKLTYVALIDKTWRERLTRPILPYIKQEQEHEHR